MHQLNEKQRVVKNAEKFRREFGNFHMAAIPIILVRTREPFRAIETLKDFAFAEKKLDFKSWSVVHGWETYDKKNPRNSPETDNITDPSAALKLIDDPKWGNGIYVMLYPHLLNMNKNPILIYLLKRYSRLFSENLKRVVLVTPQSYELPTELDDDVSILDFDPPSFAELKYTYNKIVMNLPDKNKIPKFKEADVDKLVSIGSGMTQTEFENSIVRAFVENGKELPNVPISNITNVLSACKSEVIKKTDILEIMEPVDINEVGGLQPLKDWLVNRRYCFMDDARKFGVAPPRGITLVGAPGLGKSLVAEATASMLGIPLIRFDVSRVFQSLVGSSEARIRNTLKIVESCSPCCLLLDELDKVFGGTVAGLQGDSGVGQRILGTILTWLQKSTHPVFVIATANRIEYLPPEMMRRGRMDEVFSVSMPDEAERLEIIKIHLKKRSHDPDKIKDLNIAVGSSSGYTGAEIEGCIKDALIEAWAESQKNKTKPTVTGKLIAEQLGNLKPMSEAFKEQFQAMSEWAQNNARPANANPNFVKPKIRDRSIVGEPGFHNRAMNLDG
jgi:AAA+ superfamily predicted ATPase